MNKWINADVKVPSHNHYVLVLLENKEITMSKYIPYQFRQWVAGMKFDCWDIPKEWSQVTHWMELPKAEDLEATNEPH